MFNGEIKADGKFKFKFFKWFFQVLVDFVFFVVVFIHDRIDSEITGFLANTCDTAHLFVICTVNNNDFNVTPHHY